jgi:energy-coupling factor transporter ATP-binding protein EcfA2
LITNASIALLGESGSGKTTQLGEIAKYVKKTTGLNSVLFTNERGGADSIEHLGPDGAGIIDIVRYDFEFDIFTWLNHSCVGEFSRDLTKVPPVWEKFQRDLYGAWFFDSGSSSGDEVMAELARRQASGKNIGGQSSFNVELGDGTKVASNTQTHYGLAQTYMRERIWKTQRLPGIVVWTFTLDKADDKTRGAMAGPAVAGHGLTNRLPANFRYTFRLKQELNYDAKPEHVLYLQTHTDGQMGGYSNARVPLASHAELDLKINPASVPKALMRLDELRAEALRKDLEEIG